MVSHTILLMIPMDVNYCNCLYVSIQYACSKQRFVTLRIQTAGQSGKAVSSLLGGSMQTSLITEAGCAKSDILNRLIMN